MIRKQMEDVVVHHTDAAHHVATAGRVPKHPRTPSQGEAAPTAREGDRIENNPFFEKVKTPSRALFVSEKKAPIRAWLWALVVLAVLGAGFFIANFFASATVEVVPLVYRGRIEQAFTAVKEGSSAASSKDAMVFHFVSLADELSQEVPATVEQKIQRKASGRVVIYNAYSKDAQRLIKNTRLESVDHKIFRIGESVVVPGAKVVGGKVTTPGSVEIVAYADVPGKEYNIGLGNFTIPGFKGDPRYTKFSASSKPDSPMAGGFSGTVKVPSEEAVQKAQTDIKLGLKGTAVEKARALIPAGMTFFPGSTVIKFEEVPQDLAQGDATKVTVRATVSVFFFDTQKLTDSFAKIALKEYQGNPLALSNMSDLGFTFVDKVENVVLADLGQIRFRITGDPTFVGKIDSDKIRAALLGVEKKDFAKIIVGQQNIGKAEATVRPMWKTKFPLDPSKITVDILEATP